MRFQVPARSLRLSALLLFSLIVAACGSGTGPDKVEPTAEEVVSREKVVVFRDDFGGPAVAGRPENAGARIPSAPLQGGNWVAETGYGSNGWGNDEWQEYTNSMDNLFTEDGSLVIRARCSTPLSCGKRDGTITSARIITKDRLNVRYGTIRARIKMPSGLGMWPAFWTLGSDIDRRPWPDAGEIDIVEMHYFYSDIFTTHFSTHWAGPRYTDENRPACAANVDAIDEDEEENCKTESKTFDDPSDSPLTDDFHIYELEWTQDQIIGKIDGVAYFTQAIDPATMEEFLKDHYLLLNVAVGGTLGGPFGPQMLPADWDDPDQTDMLVDWVEVSEFVQATPSTLIDETAKNIPYGGITNSVNFGGANVLADDESVEHPALVGNTVLQLDFSDSVSLIGGIPAIYSGAAFRFANVDLSDFSTFEFSIDTSQFSSTEFGQNFNDAFNDIAILFGDGDGNTMLIRTSDYTPVAISGTWQTYVIPLAHFVPVDMNNIVAIGFFNPYDEDGKLVGGTVYIDDIVFGSQDCDPGPTVARNGRTVALDADPDYNPATTVAQVTVSDACAANQLVTVEVNNLSDDSIYVGVKLDASGSGSTIFGLIAENSVCSSSDERSYIALDPDGTPVSLTATYNYNAELTDPADDSDGDGRPDVTDVAGVSASAPGTLLGGDSRYIYASNPDQALTFIPDIDFEYSDFGSGSTFDGAFTGDPDFSPVFAVSDQAGQAAVLAHFNFTPGFTAGMLSINFKVKDMPGDVVLLKFGDADPDFSVDLTTFSGSTDIGGGWYEVSVPMSNFPGVDSYDYFVIKSNDSSSTDFTFLVTDIFLLEDIEVVPEECAELIVPAGDGITPEFLLFSRDPVSAPDDLQVGVDWNAQSFGSGSVFDAAFTGDPDYDRVFSVTTGTGYTAVVGQFALESLFTGFADGFENLQFKARGLNNDLIRVKFLPSGDYVDITLSSNPNSTDLGAGWYQVSIPLSGFSGVADATALLFETDNTAASNFTFYLTDIGFSGSSGGGGSGVVPETVLFSSTGSGEDLVFGVDYTGYTPFGSGSVFNATFTGDSTFGTVFAVTTGSGYSVPVGQLGFEGFAAGFVDGVYDEVVFKIKGVDSDLIRVKFQDPGSNPYVDVTLTSSSSDYTSTAIGDGWYQVVIPLDGSFGDVSASTILIFENNTASANYTFYMTDIGFNNASSGGGVGVVPETVLFSSTGSGEDLVFGVDYTGYTSFGSGSVFDSTFTGDSTFGTVFAVTTGSGYSVPVGQLGFEGFAAGFVDGVYDEVVFKIKGVDSDLIRVKFQDPASNPYVDVTLTSSSSDYTSTDIGDGWYQVVIPLDGSFGDVSASTILIFENNTASANYTFYLTDIGFNNADSGGGGGGTDPGGTPGTFENGDFEIGDFTGWTQIPDAGSNPAPGTISIAAPPGGQPGTAVARLQAAGDAAAGSQDVLLAQVALGAGSISPGNTIDVSFDLYGSLSGAGGVVFAELIYLDSGGNETGRDFVGAAAPYFPNASWTTYTGSKPAGANVDGGVTLQLKASCGPVDGCGVDAYFDNVTYTVTP